MRYSTIGLIGLLTLTILVAPRTAAAQPPAKVVRLGYLSLQGEGPSPDTTALLQGLRDLGYVDGQNLVMEFRFAAGKSEQLPDLAAALLRLKVDVLVTFGCTATRTAANATTTTPIVIAGGCDPVGIGLIASLARPGGNITGSSALATELSGKRLEILKEGLPTISRVAVLWNAADRGMTLQYTQMQAAAEVVIRRTRFLGVLALMTRRWRSATRRTWGSCASAVRGGRCRDSASHPRVLVETKRRPQATW